MKTLLALLCFSCALLPTVHSQTMEGIYTNTWDNVSGFSLTYTLTLNPNGTFVFESSRIYEDADPSKTVVVNGTWQQDDRLLTLKTDTTTVDAALAKALNSSKARFVSYSPRHTLYGLEQPTLQFYQSEVFYAKGMHLEKTAAELVTDTIASKVLTAAMEEGEAD